MSPYVRRRCCPTFEGEAHACAPPAPTLRIEWEGSAPPGRHRIEIFDADPTAARAKALRYADEIALTEPEGARAIRQATAPAAS